MNDATKHGGPVDVRAVIRAVIEELRADGNTGHVQSLLDADAAVAELIEAGGRLQFTKRDGKFLPVDIAAIAGFVVALANIRSAS